MILDMAAPEELRKYTSLLTKLKWVGVYQVCWFPKLSERPSFGTLAHSLKKCYYTGLNRVDGWVDIEHGNRCSADQCAGTGNSKVRDNP